MMNTEAILEHLTIAGVDYVVKNHARPALTCETAAEERGVRVSQIVKCMVGRTADAQFVAMLIPGDRTLKSSKARKWLGSGSLALASAEDLENDLGLTVGAISPFQLLGRARILMDPSVLLEETVDISSGNPMTGIELKSRELLELLAAELVHMISSNSQST